MAQDFSKEELIEIRKAAKWNSSFKTREFGRFLAIPEKSIVRTSKEYQGLYFKYTISTVLEEYLSSANYKIVDRAGIHDSGYYSLKKEDIEIRPGVYKKCTTEGILFLDHGDYKFIIELEDGLRHDGIWEVDLLYRQEDEDKVLDFIQNMEKYATVHSYLKNAKIDPDLNHIPLSRSYSWDDVILPEETKEELQLNVDRLFNSLEIYQSNNITFKRGLILKGVPGTGKTLISKVLCSNANCTFIWVTPKYLSYAKQAKALCSLARELSPSILFLEDIDLYGEDRSTSGNASLLGELMNQLDGLIENHYVVVIATTNKVDMLEKALRNRPGRFDRIIHIPSPDEASRLKMLELYTQNYKLDRVDLAEIASKTEKYTGAHVKELVNTAVITAIDERSLDPARKVVLTQEHFTKNIVKVRNKRIEPSLGFSSKKPDPNLIPYEDDDF